MQFQNQYTFIAYHYQWVQRQNKINWKNSCRTLAWTLSEWFFFIPKRTTIIPPIACPNDYYKREDIDDYISTPIFLLLILFYSVVENVLLICRVACGNKDKMNALEWRWKATYTQTCQEWNCNLIDHRDLSAVQIPILSILALDLLAQWPLCVMTPSLRLFSLVEFNFQFPWITQKWKSPTLISSAFTGRLMSK